MGLDFLGWSKYHQANLFECTDCGFVHYLKSQEQLDTLEEQGCDKCKDRQKLNHFKTA